MSLYNLLYGVDTNAAMVLSLLDISEIPRFRDAYADPDTQELVILTRTGGGNRDDYESENASLQSHPLYLRDEDDEYDSTFALFYFRLPEGAEPIPNTVHRPISLREKFEKAVSSIKGASE